MPGKELETVKRYEQMSQVVDLYLKGNNATQIAKQTKMRRVDVEAYVDEWRDIARRDENVKDRAHELVMGMDQHYSMLIKKAWEVINDIDEEVTNSGITAAIIAQKNSAIKTVAELEQKRIDMMQKAGLLDDAAMGDEIAEMERKQEILVKILREVTATCDNCKYEVARRLSQVTNRVEPVVVVQPDR